jgi:hypothetical protein
MRHLLTFAAILLVAFIATIAILLWPMSYSSSGTESNHEQAWQEPPETRTHFFVKMVEVNDHRPTIGYMVRCVGTTHLTDPVPWWRDEHGNVLVKGRRVRHDAKVLKIFVADEGSEPRMVSFDRSRWEPVPNPLGGTSHGMVNFETGQLLWERVSQEMDRDGDSRRR